METATFGDSKSGEGRNPSKNMLGWDTVIVRKEFASFKGS